MYWKKLASPNKIWVFLNFFDLGIDSDFTNVFRLLCKVVNVTVYLPRNFGYASSLVHISYRDVLYILHSVLIVSPHGDCKLCLHSRFNRFESAAFIAIILTFFFIKSLGFQSNWKELKLTSR